MNFSKLWVVATVWLTLSVNAYAAITLDRTRIIFNEGQKSVSVGISNNNKTLPYLAQGWLESDDGVKVTESFVVTPPIQRVEANEKSQVKIILLPAAKNLPQDRESVYYFNLREVPPKSDKPNVMQIALQTRVKFFYRPKNIAIESSEIQEMMKQVTLEKDGKNYILNNPTPYHLTVLNLTGEVADSDKNKFESFMIAPKSTKVISDAGDVGDSPMLTFVNDYGGYAKLHFKYVNSIFTVSEIKD